MANAMYKHITNLKKKNSPIIIKFFNEDKNSFVIIRKNLQ